MNHICSTSAVCWRCGLLLSSGKTGEVTCNLTCPTFDLTTPCCGNIGCGVLISCIQNYVDFCLKLKRFDGNFYIFWNGTISSRQKLGLALLNKSNFQIFKVLPLLHFQRYKICLWTCLFLAKLSNFVFPSLRFHNPYCHTPYILLEFIVACNVIVCCHNFEGNSTFFR